MTWQPIETAPKDGRVIVAIRKGTDRRGYTFVYWFDDAWAGYTVRDEIILAKSQPTDWLPLPPPPDEA
jgi:hypothetical protein